MATAPVRPLAQDYLFVGPLIVERLRDRLAPSGLTPDRVQHIEDLATSMANLGTVSPLVYVLWEGEVEAAGPSEMPSGLSRIVRQLWSVVVYVRSASQVQSDARHMTAGPLLSSVHLALAAWRPDGSPHAFHRRPAKVRPQFLASGGLYPIGFSIDLFY